MNEVKKAYVEPKKYDKPLLECNPGDWSDECWEEAVKYWEGEAHKHRSDVGSKDHGKWKTLHSAGKKSFVEHEDDYETKRGRKPPMEFWFKKLHTKKVKKNIPINEVPEDAEYLTPESAEIAARYADIVESNRDALADMPGGVEAAEHPIEWWLEAVAPGMSKPPKNELIGFPRVPVSSILPNLGANYRARGGGRRDGAEFSSQGAAGGASQVPDQLFYNVVRSIIEDAHANPTQCHTPPSYDQVNTIATTALEMQWNPETGAAAFSNAVLGEVTRYVGTILTSIYKKYETKHQAAMKRAQEGYNTTSSSEDETEEDPDGEDDDEGGGEGGSA